MNDGTKIILILVLVAIFSILIYAGIEALIIKKWLRFWFCNFL